MGIKLAGLVIAVILSGCGGPPRFVETKLSVFHKMESVKPADTFAVLPWRTDNPNSLEFDAYVEQVATILKAKGINVVEHGRPAKYAVFLDFGIDDGRTVAAAYSPPPWNLKTATTTGTVRRSGDTAYVDVTTRHGTAGGFAGGFAQAQALKNAQGSIQYMRFVNIDIVEAGPSGGDRKVYQAQLKSEGWCGNLPSVMPAFIRSIFNDYPGQSGVSKMQRVQVANAC